MIELFQEMNERASVGLKDETYISENGIRCCNVCNEPRQEWIQMMDEQLLMTVACSCIKAEAEKRKQRERQERFEQLVSELREDGIRDAEYLLNTFERDNEPNLEASIMARRYVEGWKAMKANNSGILFHGSVGSGKTFLACAIANALIDRGVSCMVTSLPRIINEIQGTWDKSGYINRLNRYDLLVIDDFGTERNSEYGQEQVYNVIDSRLLSRKPLIVTTNLSLRDLVTPSSMSSSRIYSRLLNMTPIRIPCTRADKRAKATEAIEDRSLEILFGGEV